MTSLRWELFYSPIAYFNFYGHNMKRDFSAMHSFNVANHIRELVFQTAVRCSFKNLKVNIRSCLRVIDIHRRLRIQWPHSHESHFIHPSPILYFKKFAYITTENPDWERYWGAIKAVIYFFGIFTSLSLSRPIRFSLYCGGDFNAGIHPRKT